ncbi:SDR family NAD(P)-dependent oxidoreductase [Petrocella sp. FN5]|uniref:SDR family NAD(P)-dependent oxidoreductase n=1 Tax=Petrocella sp. FN5 TaxID=3032002 RepID=UPI0023DA4B07|nr:SDR family NAD(P)-dependent oxidoreductase [Petrocella sp. FN5]MDF1618429.1 SDR family NAD(P)-dependent oxidoreductase [Petrocella sp. FN5]
MTAKTVLITGANSGIGKASAIKFAREGYQVIMACRNLDKGRLVQRYIIETTKNSHVDLLELDLASLEAIRCFCNAYEKKYDRLDILIHNAAYLQHGVKEYQLSQDHIELSFATNAVGPFFLTYLLKDRLNKSDNPKILNACTVSIRHYFVKNRKIEFDNLQGEYKESRPYNTYRKYGESKMALLLLTFKMSEVLNKYGIKVNAIQIPAIKLSGDTRRQFKSIWRLSAEIQNAFGAEPETIANIYFDICTSEALNTVSGKLINNKLEVMKPSHYTYGLLQSIRQLLDMRVYPRYAEEEDNIERVWEVCRNMTETDFC